MTVFTVMVLIPAAAVAAPPTQETPAYQMRMIVQMIPVMKHIISVKIFVTEKIMQTPVAKILHARVSLFVEFHLSEPRFTPIPGHLLSERPNLGIPRVLEDSKHETTFFNIRRPASPTRFILYDEEA